MNQASEQRIILITRKTRLQELIERFNTWPQARFYLEHNQVDSQDYLDEHDLYQRCLLEAEQVLRPKGHFHRIERDFLTNYHFADSDIVVVLGQDGLVANTLKYLNGQPVIAINPDPDRWDGQLLPFTINELDAVIKQFLNNDVDYKNITFAQAQTNDGQSLLAVNDLFIGPQSHTSARYKISWHGKQEIQSSSGIIVSTGFGSSGWFQSILAGAAAVADSGIHAMSAGFGWDEKRLQFTVREPFPSRTTGTSLVFGAITREQTFQLESLMPENGVIFSDGIEADFLNFNSGTLVNIGIADIEGRLVC